VQGSRPLAPESPAFALARTSAALGGKTRNARNARLSRTIAYTVGGAQIARSDWRPGARERGCAQVSALRALRSSARFIGCARCLCGRQGDGCRREPRSRA
jgi:hypothetical protein